MKVASTREIINKLEAYEKLNGIGAVVGIATPFRGDRTVEYKLEIANDSDYNRALLNDGTYKRTVIDISSVDDDDLFKQKRVDDVKNLPFGTNITLRCKDGHKYKGVIYGDKIGFENGSYMKMSDLDDREIYLGWE